jgi:hypothetical protein
MGRTPPSALGRPGPAPPVGRTRHTPARPTAPAQPTGSQDSLPPGCFPLGSGSPTPNETATKKPAASEPHGDERAPQRNATQIRHHRPMLRDR